MSGLHMSDASGGSIWQEKKQCALVAPAIATAVEVERSTARPRRSVSVAAVATDVMRSWAPVAAAPHGPEDRRHQDTEADANTDSDLHAGHCTKVPCDV